MRPKERQDSEQKDLFRAQLDQIVDMTHPLAKLAATIKWSFLEERLGAVYSDAPGHLIRAAYDRHGAGTWQVNGNCPPCTVEK